MGCCPLIGLFEIINPMDWTPLLCPTDTRRKGHHSDRLETTPTHIVSGLLRRSSGVFSKS